MQDPHLPRLVRPAYQHPPPRQPAANFTESANPERLRALVLGEIGEPVPGTDFDLLLQHVRSLVAPTSLRHCQHRMHKDVHGRLHP